MKQQNIELVLGFLDAIRRRDRKSAARCLDPQIMWQGLVHDLTCYGADEVLAIFLGRRERDVEIDGLEILGTRRGAVFALHRPGSWEVAGVEVRGAMYHVATIENGRITRIEDYADREEALSCGGR